MVTGRQIAEVPISQAVTLPGGNGLASPAFEVGMWLIGVFGWQHVEEGVEALVCDGELVPRTRFSEHWLGLVGKRRFMRRVLLQPEPLVDLSAKGLTRDQLEVTLTASLKYVVIDPIYVATLQSPLAELRQLTTGVIAELIHARRFDELFADEGAIRQELQWLLAQSPTVGQHYHIVEVLKAVATGDERLVEAARQRKIAEAESGLVRARGENKVIEARYDNEVARREAELKDLIATRQHERQMELRRLELEAETQQAIVRAIGDAAQGGIDATKLASLLSGLAPDQLPSAESLLRQTAYPLETRELRAGPTSQVDRERSALASLQSAGHIESFELVGTTEELDGAIVRLPAYDIVLSCPAGYPDHAPEVVVRHRDGRVLEPVLIWNPGISSSLAHAVLSVMPQVKKAPPSQSPAATDLFEFDDAEETGGAR